MIMQSLLMSYGQAWTPAFLAAPPKLWLDDQSPITLASSAVSVWGDRSGNAWDVSQSTAANRPVLGSGLNGRRTILFDGVNDILTSGANGRGLFRNVTYGYIFSVVKKIAADGSAIDRAITGNIRGGATTGIRAGQYLGGAGVGGANIHGAGGRRLDTDSFAFSSGSTVSAGVWYMRLDYFRWADRQVENHVDGQLVASASSLWTGAGLTSDTAAGAGLAIGGQLSGSGFAPTGWADIDLACNLQGSGTLSADEIDKLFGWAAWQYGLQANLPVGHPYKNAAP